MLNNPKFDGRSYVINRLHYTLRERIIILFSMNVMPALTRLLLSHRLNTLVWRMLGCRVGPRSLIITGTQINVPFNVSIGSDCRIHGHLKSRERIMIGHGVEFVEEVFVSTQSHNMDSAYFESIYKPVKIGDYAWLGPRCIILQGVNLELGTVVAAGAVITKSTEPWGIYAGMPAKKIKQRIPLNLELS